MNRGSMRDMLRRRLQETTPKQWANADLNIYLNLGLQFVQTAVLQTSPEEFLSVSTASMVANDNLIPKPIGMLTLKKV